MTPSYRYRRTWFLLGWGMVAAVVVLSLIPLELDLGDNRDKLAALSAARRFVEEQPSETDLVTSVADQATANGCTG